MRLVIETVGIVSALICTFGGGYLIYTALKRGGE